MRGFFSGFIVVAFSISVLLYKAWRYVYKVFTSDRYTDTEAQLVERLLCDRKIVGLIPGGVIPKALKLVLAAISHGAQHYGSRAGS